MANSINPSLDNEQIQVINLDEYKEPGNSWSKARDIDLKLRTDGITPDDIYRTALKIEDYRDKALFILAYFTAGRISELVKYQKIKWGKKKVLFIQVDIKPRKRYVQDYKKKTKIGEVRDGLQKRDIRDKLIKDVPCKVIELRNLKNKKDHRKIIPIRLDLSINVKLWKLLDIYLSTLEYDYQELFPFGKRNAERIISKVGYNPHSLRKIRLTHLVQFENYDDQRLKLYAGWTDSRPAAYYVRLTYQDLV